MVEGEKNNNKKKNNINKSNSTSHDYALRSTANRMNSGESESEDASSFEEVSDKIPSDTSNVHYTVEEYAAHFYTNYKELEEKFSTMEVTLNSILKKLEASSSSPHSENITGINQHSNNSTGALDHQDFPSLQLNWNKVGNKKPNQINKQISNVANVVNQECTVSANGANRFASLHMDEDPVHGTTQISNPLKRSAKSKPKTSPIIAYNINHKKLRDTLISKKLTDYKITNSHNPHRSVIIPGSKSTRDATLELLRATEVNFYTYTPSEEKNITLLIKGIPVDFDATDINAEFVQLNLADKIVKISPLNNKKLAKFNFFLLQLLPGTAIGDFLRIKYLLNTSVRIEKFRRPDVIQCFRCQKIGHVASNCQMSFRCVKCAGEHSAADCPLTSNAPKENLKCTLCLQNGHPANYRGCSKYKQLIKSKITPAPAPPQNSRQVIPPSPVQTGISYASKANSPTANPSLVNINNILNKAANDLFSCDYLSLKSHFDNFLAVYHSMASANDKKEALLNFILNTSYNG